MYRIGNKIVKKGDKLYKAENQTILEFNVRGTSFPDRIIGSTYFQWNSSVGNKIYFDFDDGTGIHVFEPNTAAYGFLWIGQIIHYYQDLLDPLKIGTVDETYTQQRVVKVWFDYPQRVTGCLLQNFNMYGDFPKNIGNYSLSAMRFSGTRYLSSFPVKFRGGVFSSVNLTSISDVKPTVFPAWIGNSRIANLTLSNVFNLSVGSVASGIDSILGCQGLNLLDLTNNSITKNEDLPSILKDMVALRSLTLSSASFTTLPKRVTDCTQLTVLTVSGIATLTNWGEGLGNMVNLVTLYCVQTYTQTIPSTVPAALTTDLPLGLANCINLKNYVSRYTFRYGTETDTHINNWYDFILANASTTTGNTKFRNMSFDFSGMLNSLVPTRPSGGATPTSVVYPATTPMQQVYNLCKTYGHTWTVRNLANTGTETITPTS